jgi:hypothetical protein
MGPVSPDCGSKRKCPGLDLVVDQIDLLPAMVSSSSHGARLAMGMGMAAQPQPQPLPLPQLQQQPGLQQGPGLHPQGRPIKHAKRRRLADAHMAACGGEGALSDGSCTPTRSGSQCESGCPGMSEVMTRTVGEALGLS